ncbi:MULTISPECIES: cysteine hydrolase family protein [Alteribacter]|uniref:Cysteine hydrolase n=1 Tax=Alteribacter keqinensis TaxID=2483800 RepID=A0A3M7TY46_9BACI|nr:MULTISPECIES: isochorismatase family cysteine hydrolase [Alteribacter]MBM7096266.1 cysteine hydrolase [Alteribacter salitolerans]RNA70507.1 cysteine hydrolase [Alteribacter keqinensis]
MATPNNNPHVTEYQHVALLLVDVINDFEFADGEKLIRYAKPMAEKIARLKKQAKELNIPVLYINDNYGRWQSDFQALVDHCIQEDVRGHEITKLLEPEDDDYFVLKPQFSAFFNTPLDLLLEYLNVKSLIITGVAGNMCVHFTANDAYMRGYKLYLPSDCTASNHEEDNREALDLMEHVLQADTTPSDKIDLEAIKYYWRDKKKDVR